VIELRIEQLLEKRGKTFYWLAKETGIGHTSIWRLRHGEAKTISLDYLERICRALECEPGELFELVDDRRASKSERRKK
jgi:putative transcriptional regulator